MFDKAKYDYEYLKEHKVQFNIKLNVAEKKSFDELAKKTGVTKVELFRKVLKME